MRNTAAALRWIVGILKKHRVPYWISGGFAARLYGAKRELADIDIDIPEDRFEDILPDVKEYVKFGPARYVSESWDLKLLTLNYEGQDIDLCGANAKIFDKIKKNGLRSAST